MPTILANAIEHAYALHGDPQGTPTVLIAGMGGAGSYWQPQIAAFSETRHLLTYDQRGCGSTERTLVRDIGQLAEDLVALLDALHIDRADFVGHSTGGAIGMLVAARHPERVGKLVTYASIHRADAYRRRVWGLRKEILRHLGPEIYAQTTSLFFYPPDYISEHDEDLRRAEQGTARSGELPSADVQTSRIDAILAFDCVAELPRIRCPTLVCCAQDDMLTPAYFSRDIATRIGGSQLTVWPKGGHAYSRSHAAAFNQEVLGFLEQ